MPLASWMRSRASSRKRGFEMAVSPEGMRGCGALVIPGVGSFGSAMEIPIGKEMQLDIMHYMAG
jgi:imidazoleglycerol phosphate synthase glutamine amidotransferase subunit HisH